MDKFLNKSTVLRLARYLRVLRKLKSLGFVKVFSNNLGDAIGVTPSVVRKDFSCIDLPGNKRGGYNIDTIVEELSKVLGKQQALQVVLAGCGRIGTALMEYKEFAKEGIHIMAGFDADRDRFNSQSPVPIHDIREMGDFIRKNGITIGILAVPDQAASHVLEQMIAAGIQGVLNFAPVELKSSNECVIQNVNIGLEIENLFYMVRLGARSDLVGELQTV
jgi:redox-sensing transcriptional repressor